MEHSGKQPAEGKGQDERYTVTLTFSQVLGYNVSLFLNVYGLYLKTFLAKNSSIKSKKKKKSEHPFIISSSLQAHLSLQIQLPLSLVWGLPELYLCIYIQLCVYKNIYSFFVSVFYRNGNILNILINCFFYSNIFRELYVLFHLYIPCFFKTGTPWYGASDSVT